MHCIMHTAGVERLGFCMAGADAQHTSCLQDGLEMEVDALLRRKYENAIRDISIVEREDLDLVRALRVPSCQRPEPAHVSFSTLLQPLCPDADVGFRLRPQKNHLSGLKRRLLKLSFWNEQQLAEVKRDCFPLVRRNRHPQPPS
jgi:DNA polymerase epsilon subunit 1